MQWFFFYFLDPQIYISIILKYNQFTNKFFQYSGKVSQKIMPSLTFILTTYKHRLWGTKKKIPQNFPFYKALDRMVILLWELMGYEDQFNFKERGKCFEMLIKLYRALTTNIISEWSRHNKYKIGTQFMAYWFLLFLCQDRLQFIKPSIPGKFVHLQPDFSCLWVCNERQYHEFSIKCEEFITI